MQLRASTATGPVTPPLRAFMDGLIDYAGLFPPASLPMRDAVKTYARHLASDRAWMVNRFVCPIDRLGELTEEGDDVLREHAPIRVAGIATAPEVTGAIVSAAQRDAAQTKAFEDSGWGRVDVLETRLPDDIFRLDDPAMRAAIARYEAALREAGMEVDRIYYEIRRSGSWRDDVERCVSALRGDPGRGFKIRCGGVTPDAYPSPKEVADAIGICSAAGVPFKATAGLHHPIRHTRPETNVVEHGFVNVFTAGVLARTTDSDNLSDILEERDLQAFSFSDDHLQWRNRKVTADDIKAAREAFATSYGSCDIDEPVEDLEAAGLL